MAKVEDVVHITNNNAKAVAAAQCSAAVLFEVLRGTPIAQALLNALPLAGSILKPLLEEALAIPTLDSVAVAKRFGMACHVAEGLPIVFHIAQHASDYRVAVESNIRAGGDNCGRSIMLGAIVAAHKAKQDNVGCPVPLPWLARYRKFMAAADACAVL